MNSHTSFWRERPVLVTGASGLLGGWLVDMLLERGAHVVCLIRDGSPRSRFFADELDRRCSIANGSLSDRATLSRVLSEYEIDTVFHLAAQTLVGVAKRDPISTLEANVQGTWNLLEAARQAETRQIVVASSDKAYGCSDDLPYLESHPLQGEYPYDVSKSCADLICRMYARTYQLPVCITRCGNLFGGGDLNFSRTIPGVIRSTVFGEPFLIRSDGLFIRDFLYVKDAALAYLHLAEHLASDRSIAGEAFNFSMGIRLTVLDLVEQVLEMMGAEHLQPVIQNIASSEIREQYMDAGKAARVLGWTPRYTLREGLSETISWYVEFLQDSRVQPVLANTA
jgi:CDP-glucose 4,6-dehydratase